MVLVLLSTMLCCLRNPLFLLSPRSDFHGKQNGGIASSLSCIGFHCVMPFQLVTCSTSWLTWNGLATGTSCIAFHCVVLLTQSPSLPSTTHDFHRSAALGNCFLSILYWLLLCCLLLSGHSLYVLALTEQNDCESALFMRNRTGNCRLPVCHRLAILSALPADTVRYVLLSRLVIACRVLQIISWNWSYMNGYITNARQPLA